MVNDGSLRLSAWESNLPAGDPHRDFIIEGVREGFHIVNTQQVIPAVLSNYKSATNPLIHDMVEAQIGEEIANGRYVVPSQPPILISAIGAIPKRDSDKVRLIHDCSRPSGAALNDFAYSSHFTYQSVADAVAMIKPDSYLAKIDLSNAYRSVRIHPSNYVATGLQWTFTGDNQPTALVDTRLPFGARKSPEIFNHLSQAVCRIMKGKGYGKIIAYLDDFLVIGDTYRECYEAKSVLFKLLRELGFAINYNKLEGPTRKLVFLGILLDTERQVLELSKSKISQVQQSIASVSQKVKVTKRELQSLCGKLNWCCQVIYGGRPHLRRIINRMNSLQRPWHRTRITQEVRLDLCFWQGFMAVFNGITPMVDNRPGTAISTDACNVAAGAVFGDKWVYTPWSSWPGTEELHINHKETLAVLPAATLWAPWWRDRKVYIHMDNQAAVGIINKGTCRHPLVMASLRRLFWLSAIYNFRVKAVYYPGVFNRAADNISRLHEFAVF